MVKKIKNTFSNYKLGDFLIRVKNAARAGRNEIVLPSTKLVNAVALCLKEEGYLSEVKTEEGVLTAKLTISHKKPVLMDLKLVSKPGLRVYVNLDQLKARKVRASNLILSTPKGIMFSRKAVKNSTGGEVIAEIV